MAGRITRHVARTAGEEKIDDEMQVGGDEEVEFDEGNET